LLLIEWKIWYEQSVCMIRSNAKTTVKTRYTKATKWNSSTDRNADPIFFISKRSLGLITIHCDRLREDDVFEPYFHIMPRDRECSVKFWFILGASLVLLYWIARAIIIRQASS